MARAGLLDRVCDQCGESGLCQTVEDAYICEACMDFYERSIDAGTDAVMRAYELFRDPKYGTALVRQEVREIVAVAVKAFCEFGNG